MADKNSLFSFHCPGFYVETGGAPLWAPQYVTRQEFRKALPRPKTVTSPPDRNDLPISAAAPRRDLPVSPTLAGSDWRSRRVSLRHPSGSLTHNGPTYTFRGYTLPGFRVPFISQSRSPDSANPPFLPAKEEYKSRGQHIAVTSKNTPQPRHTPLSPQFSNFTKCLPKLGSLVIRPSMPLDMVVWVFLSPMVPSARTRNA